MKTLRRILAALFVFAAAVALAQQPLPADDAVLTALKDELKRSQDKLQLPGQSKPYFVQYVVNDTESYAYESSLGAPVNRARMHNRLVTVFVRVGDYREDNDMGYGLGLYEMLPGDDDVLALRRALWLATDSAYKAALQMATAKESLLKQYEHSDEDVASFSKEKPAQYFEPRAAMPADFTPYERALDQATALYRTDPEIQSLSGSVRFNVNNYYVVNTEGTAMRMAQGGDSVSINADTQAADGQRLRRNYSLETRTAAGLPDAAALKAKTAELLATLKALRTAPRIGDEEYRGPVLFSGDAAGTIVESLLAKNLVGRRPQPGKSGRVVGLYAESLHGRILPDSVKVVDDPTLEAYAGQPLAGYYPYDDEGVKARPVMLVDKGVLQNYVMSRRPIRGFENSNGHGRNLGAAIDPWPANFILTTSSPTPAAQMKQKLLELCKQRELEYCYYVKTMAGIDNPRLLYRVYTKDGHEELVRGGALDELDARSLRTDLAAIGDDPFVTSNPASLPTSYVAPSMLFGEIVVKRSTEANDKLPDYPAPAQ